MSQYIAMTEPHNLAATVYVYRQSCTGEIRAHYDEAARDFERAEDRWEWQHVASIEPRLWIQAHYKTIKEGES